MTQAEDKVKRLEEQLVAAEERLRTQDGAHKIAVAACATKAEEAERKTSDEGKRLNALLAAAENRTAQAETKAAEAEAKVKEAGVRKREVEAELSKAETLARANAEKWFEQLTQYKAEIAKTRNERTSMIVQVPRACKSSGAKEISNLLFFNSRVIASQFICS